MGSMLEINDTLQLTTEQGFPAETLRSRAAPPGADHARRGEGHGVRVQGQARARFFHLDPVRVYWYHNIDGRWLAWGRSSCRSRRSRGTRAPQPHQGAVNVSDPDAVGHRGQVQGPEDLRPAVPGGVHPQGPPPSCLTSSESPRAPGGSAGR